MINGNDSNNNNDDDDDDDDDEDTALDRSSISTQGPLNHVTQFSISLLSHMRMSLLQWRNEDEIHFQSGLCTHISMTSYERLGVWNHRQIENLFNNFFGSTTKETPKFRG